MLAPFGARAFAWVIDAVPHAVVPWIVASTTGSLGLGIAAFAAVGVVWHVVPEGLAGWTLGKRAAGIAVYDDRRRTTVDDPARLRIGVLRAAVRWLVKYPVGGWFPVGYLWYLRDPARRTWHDLAAGTTVVVSDRRGRTPSARTPG